MISKTSRGGIRKGAGAKPFPPRKRDFCWNQGQLLRKARQEWQDETGKTLEQLVKAAGINRSTYVEYESGRTCPTTWMLANLAHALKVPVELLFPERV